MSAQTFISHSSKDQEIAGKVCDALERRGLTCWIANRHVDPGENFQEQIVKAIRSAKVMVLVFTENANNSEEIKKELALASRYKLVVIPARVEDVIPSDAFELEFATRQWINLFDNWERELDRLCSRIKAIVNAGASKSAVDVADERAPPAAPIRRWWNRVAAGQRRSSVAVAIVTALAVSGMFAVALMQFRKTEQLPPSEPKTDQVEVTLAAPVKTSLQPAYDLLKRRMLLEGTKQVLSPLRLPRKLPLKAEQCNQVNSFYDRARDGGVTICYELVEWMQRAAPKDPSPERITPEGAVVAALIQLVFHQTSHGILSQLKVSGFGPREDSADHLGAFMLSSFQTDVAKYTLVGTAHFVQSPALTVAGESFSVDHGGWLSRFRNMLCLSYGGDILGFSELAQRLPNDRVSDCPSLYQHVRSTFVTSILPHIDRDLMRRVQGSQWLRPEDK